MVPRFASAHGSVSPDLPRAASRYVTGKLLIASKDVAPGSRIGMYGGRESQLVAAPSMHTVQLHDGAHAEAVGGMEYASHCCRPNCVLEPVWRRVGQRGMDDLVGLAVVSTQWIEAGAPITFDYNSSEECISHPFMPGCKVASKGDPRCRDAKDGVRGFAFLSRDEQENVLPIATPFLRQRAEEERNTARKDQRSPVTRHAREAQSH